MEQLPEQLEEEREEEEDLDVESVGNFGMMSDPGSFKSNDSLILDDEDVDELNEIVNSKVDITLDQIEKMFENKTTSNQNKIVETQPV